MHHKKRIMITGGSGFLGSHLCERLLAKGCDVQCADNYFTGTKDQMNIIDDFTGPVNLGNPCEFYILELAR